MTELELRAAATSATFQKFNGQALALGKVDCARMIAFHLKQIGFKPSLLKGGAYSTPVGARRALLRLGVSSLSEIMDRHFPRLDAVADARLGDICCVAGDGDMGDAMQVKLHRNHVLGFHDGVCGELVVLKHGSAWRVI
ncbi:MAG: DUF6950 family protein [Brevundimonas sp.]